MKPSTKSLSWSLNRYGFAALVLAGFSAYFDRPVLALIFALFAGTQFIGIREYHIEKSAHLRTLVQLVGNVGPRDKRYAEIADVTISRLSQIARKSQTLPNERLDEVTRLTLEFQLKLEDIITKEGL